VDSIQPPAPETVKREIALEIARVHVESYGEAALNLRVAVDEELIAVMMDIEFSPAERTLLAAGRADAVRSAREAYQDAIGEVFVAIVERASGRQVSGFASRAVVTDATPWAAEIFRLRPEAALN
jgi:uncharacterized protein YbcI